MSNFETKFERWREKMNGKTDRERHVYAMSVSVLLSTIVFFFVASNWYFQISGDSFNSSLFTDLEDAYRKQKSNFIEAKASFSVQSKELIDLIKENQNVSTSTGNTLENKE